MHVNDPNGISIGSAVFAQLTHVPNRQTDRYTDHATCDICSNRLRRINSQFQQLPPWVSFSTVQTHQWS